MYCLKYRKSTESNIEKLQGRKNGRIILLSKCAVCDSKRLEFMKEKDTKALLSSLGLKTPFKFLS